MKYFLILSAFTITLCSCQKKPSVIRFTYQLEMDESPAKRNVMNNLVITSDTELNLYLMEWDFAGNHYELFATPGKSQITETIGKSEFYYNGSALNEKLKEMHLPFYQTDSIADYETVVLGHECKLAKVAADSNSVNYVEFDPSIPNYFPLFGDIKGLPLCFSFWLCGEDLTYKAVKKEFPVSLEGSFSRGNVDGSHRNPVENIGEAEVYGRIKELATGDPLALGSLLVVKDGERDTTIVLDCDGRYNLKLFAPHRYDLSFGGAGYITKKIRISLFGVYSADESYSMEIDGALFDSIPGVDFSFMREPVAYAFYDQETKTMVFDLEHAAHMRALIEEKLAGAK